MGAVPYCGTAAATTWDRNAVAAYTVSPATLAGLVRRKDSAAQAARATAGGRLGKADSTQSVMADSGKGFGKNRSGS